ncbi:hypothetical protein LMG28140_02295 [Paraburkholderia metrosideri]|jgi:hypothetical protein|uniref:Beta-xylosidase n=2 Tax=Paraburkholderia metrosideri TaxID=580937 RepID=A0ABM8NKD6_9BURK|nr:hypothetical protein LMG28140_02295 [Paraburkholderia metrosideri]
MARLNVLFDFKRSFYLRAKLRASAACASFLLGGAMIVASDASFAQITQGNGSSQQENRTSAMGSTPDPAASMVHESKKPQTKDGGSANARGKTAGPDQKPHGAGSFDNGLYGTGAGSNK